MAGELF